MAVLIKGKDLAEKIKIQIKEEVDTLTQKPGIAVIIVGNDPASKIYVGNKKKSAEFVGFYSEVVEFDESVTQRVLEEKIDELNNNPNINAILVQLPLPKHINSYDIIERILPEKDVDGFHPINTGKLNIGLKPYSIPCTPLGVMKLLEEYGIEVESRHAVVIGRSNIVGKPMSQLLLEKNATVTICHSKTKDLKEITKQADILVSAIGRSKFIKADFVKEGATVIDVGISRTQEGKITGDVEFEDVEPKAGFITPVPGGVGPMTIAMLLFNTLNLYKLQRGE